MDGIYYDNVLLLIKLTIMKLGLDLDYENQL